MRSYAFFSIQDLSPVLPAAGLYNATITQAGLRHSSHGNLMLFVLLRLDGLCPSFQSLADYFVLEGASPHGLSVARRRLLQLYYACGIHPAEGQEILPSQLIESRLQVKVDRAEWENHQQLRVLSYGSARLAQIAVARPRRQERNDP